jgi:hypothetical protein
MGGAHSENCNHAAIEWEEHYGRVSPFSSQTDDVKNENSYNCFFLFTARCTCTCGRR